MLGPFLLGSFRQPLGASVPIARLDAQSTAESIRVVSLIPGVTATLVAPATFDPRAPIELILYALPNGNTTAETMGRTMAPGVGWRHGIQHIAAQARALRALGHANAVVAYLETDGRSWPAWRRQLGYARANARIVGMVDQLRALAGDPARVRVTLAAHSGGGGFVFGFIEGQRAFPDWLERIALLDANYNFAAGHAAPLVAWLRRDPAHRLVSLAYDDREITLDGKKVVSDSGGTWRATERMRAAFAGTAGSAGSAGMPTAALTLVHDTLGAFLRWHSPQVELLAHPNPDNRILHTELIGEMNGFLHALRWGRAGYDARTTLRARRAYTAFVDSGRPLPEAEPAAIPPRRADAPSGAAVIAELSALDRDAVIRRELLAGNVPAWTRAARTVRYTALDSAGVQRRVELEVLPDYLAIGGDDDWVRMPMSPHVAQAFADAFGFTLPTRMMVDRIWRAADEHLDPWPLTEAREAPGTFYAHHLLIERQRAGRPRGSFVAGIKKDVVLTNRLAGRADRVAIYGWHYANGVPIQPVYVGHVDWYVDYSHGIRLVRRRVRIDGQERDVAEVLADPLLAPLVSDEGPLRVLRYDR